MPETDASSAEVSTPVIDTHHHFWRTGAQEQPWRHPEHEVLAEDYLPGDLVPQIEDAGVDATVLVQSVDTAEENDQLHEFASGSRTVAGVVGYLPLQDPEAARAELARADTTWWRGVRCLVARDPLAWLSHPPVRAFFEELAAQGLAWDVVVVTSEQARTVAELARAVPDLRIVIDHLARPPVDGADIAEWQDRVDLLAGEPGSAMKLSVGIDALSTWERWDPARLGPFIDHAIARFGADRLMLASNWPVCRLAAEYGTVVHDLSAVLAARITAEELARVRGANAAQWYRLALP